MGFFLRIQHLVPDLILTSLDFECLTSEVEKPFFTYTTKNKVHYSEFRFMCFKLNFNNSVKSYVISMTEILNCY